jgi:putative SOS response-associated peptidase YedK
VCGRFSLAYEDWSEVLRYFGIGRITTDYPPRYNIAPSQQIPAILSDGTTRRFGMLKWGLQPAAWGGGGPKPINTRVDTLQRNPVLRRLVERKRCIVPCTGYFEWHRNTKDPFHIRVKSSKLVGLAAIYDTWESPDGRLSTCSILTCEADFALAPMHNRMPVILRKQDYDLYLDRGVHSLDELLPVLKPYPADDMVWYRVPKLVGNPRNDVPECIQAIE